MTSGVRNSVLASLGFVAIVVGMFFYSVMRPPVLSVQELQERGIVVLPFARELNEFSLVDHRGADFDVTSLLGRWSFLFFGFSACPDVCPLALGALAQAERVLQTDADATLRDGFNVVFVTVDPERDDQQALAQYVEVFSPRFTGVTGSREQLAEFAQQLNVAFMQVPLEGGGYSVDHTGNIVMINPRGHYHGFIKMPHDAEKILLGYRSIAGAF
ncbi:MAG: SCO family protein [Gammaproteobacteria bacterium]|nr:MAG: SCO family protein [Gammaproteobacteria bacterium]